jgi:hypothetical protein
MDIHRCLHLQTWLDRRWWMEKEYYLEGWEVVPVDHPTKD